MISLPVVLAVAALLLAIGVYGILSQTNAIMVIMGIELVLGAAMLNIVGFLRYSAPQSASGSMFALVTMTLMAVEATVGFALVISGWRRRRTAELDDLHDLKG